MIVRINAPLIFVKKKSKIGGCFDSYFLLMRRRLVHAIARNSVATTNTTNVAIGSHSETIEVGVYLGNAIAMLASCPEYSGGFAVYPMITQPRYDVLYLVAG